VHIEGLEYYIRCQDMQVTAVALRCALDLECSLLFLASAANDEQDVLVRLVELCGCCSFHGGVALHSLWLATCLSPGYNCLF
jgi:hypothetical protein